MANLPYYITTPILMNLLQKRVPCESITVMVQREVADRMQAGPGGKEYGALSLAVQYYAQPEVMARVLPQSFMPRPKVDSAVIRLDARSAPAVRVADEELLFRLIRAAFNQRRKTLANALANAQELPFSREQVTRALAELGQSPAVRGEALTLEQFAALADVLADMR